MPKATSEVLIGTGTLYLAPVGTAFPADPSAAPAVAWVDIGYSEEGWSFNADRTIEGVEVAEEMEVIALLQTARELHIVGAAAQASIDNLKIALGGGTIVTAVGPPATKTLTPASLETVDAHAALLRVNAPGTSKVRDIRVPKAINVGAFEMAHRKAPDKTMLAMDFQVVKQSGVDPFTIVDLT